MNVRIIRARIKEEGVESLELTLQDMFEEIRAAQPPGMRYMSYKLSDGVTYLAVLELEEGVENPLPSLASARRFQQGLRGWFAQPPEVEVATVLGSYG